MRAHPTIISAIIIATGMVLSTIIWGHYTLQAACYTMSGTGASLRSGDCRP